MSRRLGRIKILLVISSDKAAALIDALFRQLGFSDILIAYDAAQAVSLLRENRAHLLVTDVELKVNTSAQEADYTASEIELSGIRFIERLRHASSSPAPFIPVLMLMDLPKQTELAQARDAGVNDVIMKPMQARDFCRRVIALIDKPRIFVDAPDYKGPCRRRDEGPPPATRDRRVRKLHVIPCNHPKSHGT